MTDADRLALQLANALSNLTALHARIAELETEQARLVRQSADNFNQARSLEKVITTQNQAIADAAELFTMAIAEGAAAAFEGQPWPTGETTHEGMHAWLARPEVVTARKK